MTSRPRPRGAPTRRALGREDGLAAVELALALPFLALLLVGLVDIGTVVYHQMQLAAAARAGAELGLLGGTDPDRVAAIRAAAEAAAPPASGGAREIEVVVRCECPGGLAVSCSTSCLLGSRSGYLEVEIAQPVALIIPWPGIGSEVRIAATAVTRLY
ncbi:MAG: TadE/TadG family type IV pilus assembly protein [Geminicoccaceae bacterium]